MASLVYLLLIIILTVFSTTYSYQTNIYDLINKIKSGKLSYPYTENNGKAAEEFYFTQKLNHFDIFDNRTWQQRYFISNEFYVTGSPIFLFIAGEWEADPLEITATFIGELAQQHNALMIDLEHRYYGQSRPTNDTTSENLIYLNADQALEDAAAFTVAIKEQLNLTGPWVVFGRSYAGQLASWARAKYPHLYNYAIASSATVLAKLDVPEYMEVTGIALEQVSPVCTDVISAGMTELQTMVSDGLAANITELFNTCDEINLSIPEDVMALYLYIALHFGNEVQYARNGSLIEICDTLIEGQDTPLETLATMIRRNYFPLCLQTSAEKLFAYFRNKTNWEFPILHNYYYQLCTEYGQYMSLSSPNQPFGQVVPVEAYLLWCPNVYGPQYTREVNEAGIERTNLIYGGVNPQVSHVLYTQGSLDPWYPIGILQSLGPDTPVIMIQGESHCRDLDERFEFDSQPLIDARVQMAQILDQWIQQFYNQ